MFRALANLPPMVDSHRSCSCREGSAHRGTHTVWYYFDVGPLVMYQFLTRWACPFQLGLRVGRLLSFSKLHYGALLRLSSAIPFRSHLQVALLMAEKPCWPADDF